MCTKDQDAKHCSEAGADANEEPLFCWSSENQYPITGPGRGRLANEIWTSLLWFHICPHNSLLSGVSCLKCIPSLSPHPLSSSGVSTSCDVMRGRNKTLGSVAPQSAKYDVTSILICSVCSSRWAYPSNILQINISRRTPGMKDSREKFCFWA